MASYLSHLLRLLSVMTLLLLSVGCSSVVKSDNLGELQIGSPLRSITSKTFAFKEFSDIRGGSQSVVGDCGIVSITLDQPAAKVVESAIRKELERNGHKSVMVSSNAKPDFIVEGTVYKFAFTLIKSGALRFNSKVAVKLTFTSALDDKKALQRKYEGEYQISRTFVAPADTCLEIYSQALSGMLKDMSTDEELIAFLGK